MEISGFHIDDDVEDKLAGHGVTIDAIFDVLEGEYRVKRNKKNRRATHVVIGHDRHGVCLLIFIEPTNDPATWRPVTAWYPDSAHQQAWCP